MLEGTAGDCGDAVGDGFVALGDGIDAGDLDGVTGLDVGQRAGQLPFGAAGEVGQAAAGGLPEFEVRHREPFCWDRGNPVTTTLGRPLTWVIELAESWNRLGAMAEDG